VKALILEDKRKLVLKNVDTPSFSDAEVLIDIEVAGIGGSEYLGFNNPGIRPLPHIMGHGITGLTPEGKRVAIYPLQGCGECVYCKDNRVQLCDKWTLIGVHCDGGFAQKVAIPRELLFELPNELTWEQSAFIEPFANSMNAWEISQASRENSIAIIGAGSLGLGLVACAHAEQCQVIEVSDLSESRLDAAKCLGATKSAESLDGQFDIVFDTVGTQETRALATQLSKKGGKSVFLGFATPMFEVNFAELIRHQKQLLGSFVYSKEHFQKAMHLAKNCQSEWVTNLTFVDVKAQLEKYLNNDFSTVKAVHVKCLFPRSSLYFCIN
jgi:threonine dehydrogenase-like Zn-dependent dehydrogenase